MLRLAIAVLAIATLVVPFSLAAREKRQTGVCEYGKSYMDKCDNECNCLKNGEYACTRKGCQNPGDAGVPKDCDSSYQTHVEYNKRLFCKAGIVQFVSASDPEKCDPGTSWKDDCNTCSCGVQGDFAACTLKACVPSGAIIFDSVEHPVLKAQDVADLEYGDITVNSYAPCPNGLVEGPTHGLTKICRGKGCTVGVKYTLDDGCTKCVCLENGEPACGPCYRKPTADTPICGSFQMCPADCSKVFLPKKNCYKCCTDIGVVGEPIPIKENCPKGTDVSMTGFVRKFCAPYHLLPQGDTRICERGMNECPQDCGLVRIAPNEGCIYCQCGPETKPTPCKPGEKRTIDCNTCVCLESGYMACTKKDCNKGYEQVICGVEDCPAENPKLVDKKDDCLFCSSKQNRAINGELRVPKDGECPEGMVQVREDFNTIVCVRAPTPPPME